jgi:hypothetical protein
VDVYAYLVGVYVCCVGVNLCCVVAYEYCAKGDGVT